MSITEASRKYSDRTGHQTAIGASGNDDHREQTGGRRESDDRYHGRVHLS